MSNTHDPRSSESPRPGTPAPNSVKRYAFFSAYTLPQPQLDWRYRYILCSLPDKLDITSRVVVIHDDMGQFGVVDPDDDATTIRDEVAFGLGKSTRGSDDLLNLSRMSIPVEGSHRWGRLSQTILFGVLGVIEVEDEMVEDLPDWYLSESSDPPCPPRNHSPASPRPSGDSISVTLVSSDYLSHPFSVSLPILNRQ